MQAQPALVTHSFWPLYTSQNNIPFWKERRPGQVVRATILWYKKFSEGRKFENGLVQPTTGKLCQPSRKWLALSNQYDSIYIYIKEEERDGLRLLYIMPKLQWASNPYPPPPLGLLGYVKLFSLFVLKNLHKLILHPCTVKMRSLYFRLFTLDW